MMLIATLFVTGIILLAIEVVIPGAIVGIIGAVLMSAGVVVAFQEFGVTGGAIATLLAVLLGAVALYLEFSVFPKTRLARRFSLSQISGGRTQPELGDPAALLQREAVAVTTLAPTGYVELDGRRYEAFCQSGQVKAGARLKIVDMDAFRLVVTQIKESS
jgi:membrane-bound serine protease (ClpP class)